SLTLSSTMPGTEDGDQVAGSATNGAEATWTFTFTTASAGAEVFNFLVCDDPISSTCTMPAGLDVDSLTLDAGNSTVAGSVLATAGGDPNDFVFTAGSAVGASSTVTLVFENIQNPNVIPAFFVRITTDAGDDGVVASAITTGIEITARVKETLGFSTGAVPSAGVGAAGGSCD